jgi:hypothetical protein
MDFDLQIGTQTWMMLLPSALPLLAPPQIYITRKLLVPLLSKFKTPSEAEFLQFQMNNQTCTN